MALSATQGIQLNYGPEAVVPMSGLAEWVTVRSAGGLAIDNAGTVLIPLTHITGATNRIIDIGPNGGTYAAFRAFYDDGDSPATALVIKLFGSSSPTDATKWQVLKNRSKSVTASVAYANTDMQDGTLGYTTPDPDDHVFDLMGCRYLLPGITVTFAAGGGTYAGAASAGLQIKVF